MIPRRPVWQVMNVHTQLLHWPAATPVSKKATESTNPEGERSERSLLLFIPGNPGVIEFYESFLGGIHRETGGQLAIFGVQHAGHGLHHQQASSEIDNVEKTDVKPSMCAEIMDESHVHASKSGLYSLEWQIQHKLAILDEIVLRDERFKDHRIILAGHSVGAYIAFQMLKRRSSYPISRVIHLFPTLEHIQRTPNGQTLWPAFETAGRFAVGSVAWFLSKLPSSSLKRVMSLLVSHSEGLDHTLRLVDRQVAMNCLYMAKTEMQIICDLDEHFDHHIQKMVFYYGETDGWVPKHHYEQMRMRYPDAQVYMCTDKLPHAFVLDPNGVEILAKKFCSWIDASNQ